ncbi:hypothetical protein BDD14_4705 [Edaphobacter modestus]|uniref:Uncharacterized protein n=1 Tax=Edaphobacter modestus TaxID=388466 RepID=A0A4Q7YZW1_9BACT|nr:hypothetical protein BDD14_4705 [Edaphobacter modestus]
MLGHLITTKYFRAANSPTCRLLRIWHPVTLNSSTIKAAIESINKGQQLELVSWESLDIGGKYIIHKICDMIDESDYFCADITTINPDVMFSKLGSRSLVTNGFGLYATTAMSIQRPNSINSNC